ncbi:TDP-N-acetylfucosamine:lipid II N-acetylfucosaminyltransferase [Pseudoalteromonas sp. R3]|uniref:TDP-N-acetylfucosamine:lipid II N-acetylfucosaminyltransferase n=1 Tax=Pseudoalteromonas sp. R3 TaxID=1709477 RepID=UPI0006B55C56|nr:TDP-N-acetylfucosamine:lipid II N-acetylfucosaminyltransferase [Pseudoalteromonas sp. R3]AZZ99590.1 hypothetical protein ELR70_22490 [Pseudoalteromonas sp. R3]
MKHLHLMKSEKFVPAVIETINDAFPQGEHHFLVFEGSKDKNYPANVTQLSSRNLKQLIATVKHAQRADRVYFHGLFVHILVVLFSLMTGVLRKSVWILWGNDLYAYNERKLSIAKRCYEYFRSRLIKNISTIATSMDGEFALARQWYQTRARHYKGFTYPSVTVKPDSIAVTTNPSSSNAKVRILVGNSATAVNNHAEVLRRIKEQVTFDFEVICPLNYGDSAYGDEVESLGGKLFGDRFTALRKMLPLDEYNALLASIDVAIFDMNRQQAMGNIIQLLAMGKVVCMREGTSSYNHLTQLGIKIYSKEKVLSSPVLPNVEENVAIVRTEYSQAQLLKNLNGLFSDE